ncbi:histidine phosphatase family protein [bacterium]|nr:histidine phosphatase family protein [bacterium]
MEEIIRRNLSNMSLVPPSVGMTILLRHSHRFEIPKGEFGNEILLTPEGKKSAMELGRNILLPISSVLTSPVSRCVQTSQCLLEGQANSTIELRYDTRLGNPGAFISDSKFAGSTYLEMGHRKLNNNYIARRPVNGMFPIEEGVNRLFSSVFPIPKAPEVKILVSHDSIIGFLLAWIFSQTDMNLDFWPKTLESVVFWETENSHYLAWREKSFLLNALDMKAVNN